MFHMNNGKHNTWQNNTDIKLYDTYLGENRAVLEVNPYAIQVYHRVCDSADTTHSVYPRVEFITAFAVHHEAII